MVTHICGKNGILYICLTIFGNIMIKAIMLVVAVVAVGLVMVSQPLQALAFTHQPVQQSFTTKNYVCISFDYKPYVCDKKVNVGIV